MVPLASQGLFKSDNVELGVNVLVAEYLYGELFSNSITVTKGILSTNKGMVWHTNATVWRAERVLDGVGTGIHSLKDCKILLKDLPRVLWLPNHRHEAVNYHRYAYPIKPQEKTYYLIVLDTNFR